MASVSSMAESIFLAIKSIHFVTEPAFSAIRPTSPGKIDLLYDEIDLLCDKANIIHGSADLLCDKVDSLYRKSGFLRRKVSVGVRHDEIAALMTGNAFFMSSSKTATARIPAPPR